MTEMSKEEMMERLMTTVAHPEFEKFVQEIEQQPEGKRLEWTEAHGTIDEMKKRGIPVEKGLRLSIRTFENPDSPKPEFGATAARGTEAGTAAESSGPTICLSFGVGLCVSVGDTLVVSGAGTHPGPVGPVIRDPGTVILDPGTVEPGPGPVGSDPGPVGSDPGPVGSDPDPGPVGPGRP